MDPLHKNIAYYTHSGSKPCKNAARGELTIGVSFAFLGAKSKSEGAPLEIVIPSEGIGWDAEAAAIVAGTDYEDEAKKLLDYAISEQAMEEYNVGYAVLANPGIAKPVKNYTEVVEAAMIDNNFEWSVANRERILAEWAKRYEGKSEAK